MSKSKNRQPIVRQLGSRLLDLRTSLYVIRDCVEGIQQRKTHLIVPIYGQLRSLLSEKSRNNDPLLIGIAKELRMDIRPFKTDPRIDSFEKMTGIKNADEIFSFPEISTTRISEKQTQTSIEDLLATTVLSIQGHQYSLEDLIKLGAEKAGGAHWGKIVHDENDISILDRTIFGSNLLFQALFQLSIHVLEVGANMIRTLSEFSTHFCGTFSRSKQILCLVEYSQDEEHPAFISIHTDGATISAQVIAINGETARTSTFPNLDLRKQHHISLIHHIDESLNSTITLAIDGYLASKLTLPKCLIMETRREHIMCLVNPTTLRDKKPGLSVFMIENAFSNAHDHPYRNPSIIRECAAILATKDPVGTHIPSDVTVSISNTTGIKVTREPTEMTLPEFLAISAASTP